MITISQAVFIAPPVFGFLMFFCNTKAKMVSVNFIISMSWCFVFYFQDAKSGILVSAIAGLSSLYTAIKNNLLSGNRALLIIVMMLIVIIGINVYEGSFNLISLVPLMAFSTYRYAELCFKEIGYRRLSILGSLLYMIYAIMTLSYGVAIGCTFFIMSNIYYLVIYNKNNKANIINI